MPRPRTICSILSGRGILGIDVDSTPGAPFLLRVSIVDRHLVHDLTFPEIQPSPHISVIAWVSNHRRGGHQSARGFGFRAALPAVKHTFHLNADFASSRAEIGSSSLLWILHRRPPAGFGRCRRVLRDNKASVLPWFLRAGRPTPGRSSVQGGPFAAEPGSPFSWRTYANPLISFRRHGSEWCTFSTRVRWLAQIAPLHRIPFLNFFDVLDRYPFA